LNVVPVGMSHSLHANLAGLRTLRWLTTMRMLSICMTPGVSGTLEGDGFSPAKDGDWRHNQWHDILENVMGVTEEGDIDSAVTGFDAYSESHGLGMHLGAEKGDVIEATVQDAFARHGNGSSPFAVLEVGAHFGDGTLRIIRALQGHAVSASFQGEQSRTVVSFEGDKAWASGCRALVRHARGGRRGASGLRHEALVVRPGAVVKAAKAVLDHFQLKHFNVVLLDHDHKHYLKDLRGLVSIGAIAPNGIVHADNAGRDARILAKYLSYVQGEGPFETRFEQIQAPYPDRVAISQYKPSEREL